MLPELLLSLSSGHRSQIWERVKRGDAQQDGIHNYVSEPEKAMLEVLGHISELHIQIKEAAARIAVMHSSVICRGIGSAISETHLTAFRTKVVEVEASILSRDAGYVGGYGIVPLSTIVSEFAPWTRRLEWLAKVTRYPEGIAIASTRCTGKDMLDFLQAEKHTGYADIEDMATKLLTAGQKIWLRLSASWILYGKLPAFGADDFFVQRNPKASSAIDQYTTDRLLIPAFVSTVAAESILAVGTALIHIQSHTRSGASQSNIGGIQPSAFMPRHLQALESLTYPVNASIFEGLIIEIDCSTSQNALSQLLPFAEIMLLMNVIHKFMLVQDGEFAMSLIEHAAEKIEERQQSQVTAKPVRKTGRLDELTIKDAELGTILNKTWDELAAIQSDISLDDKFSELARKILVFRRPDGRQIVPISNLLPTTAILDLHLGQDSNLMLFLYPADIQRYSSINAYLLSVRRTELHLANLWKMTSQRRCHPAPPGPPQSTSAHGQQALLARRKRDSVRAVTMRQHWATTSKALFVLKELDTYFHGEIIRNSWDHFIGWLRSGGTPTRPGSSYSRGSRPGTASSMKTGQLLSDTERDSQKNNPRALSRGHHLFLRALHSGLLLEDEQFVNRIRDMLTLIDHYVALFFRLHSVWEGLDLQEDDGVVDAFSNFVQDERDLLGEMARSRMGLEEQIKDLVQRLKDLEKDRTLDTMTIGVAQLDFDKRGFLPWTPRTMDRLVMKLDFLSGMKGENAENNELANDIDD